MSIDAEIIDTTRNDDGTETLHLAEWRKYSCAGQPSITITNPPSCGLRGMIGTKVWGSSSDLMVGERQIAKRVGYTRAVLISLTFVLMLSGCRAPDMAALMGIKPQSDVRPDAVGVPSAGHGCVVDMVPLVAPLFVKPPPVPEPPGPTIPPVVIPLFPGGQP